MAERYGVDTNIYWMIECTGCGVRRVVRDCYLVYVGGPDAMEGEGYIGPPLPERYGCTKGCTAPMRTIASISEQRDRAMRLHEPYKQIVMNRSQSDEWVRLIREAGLLASELPSIPEDKSAGSGRGLPGGSRSCCEFSLLV